MANFELESSTKPSSKLLIAIVLWSPTKIAPLKRPSSKELVGDDSSLETRTLADFSLGITTTPPSIKSLPAVS
jgi:hypothetical protein